MKDNEELGIRSEEFKANQRIKEHPMKPVKG
jgi:hypothetical protein